MSCLECSYFWRASEYDADTGETIWLEDRASCHFNKEGMFGVPAPCEVEDW